MEHLRVEMNAGMSISSIRSQIDKRLGQQYSCCRFASRFRPVLGVRLATKTPVPDA